MNTIRGYLRDFKKTSPNIYAVMMASAVILFVRGVIGFADIFIFPLQEITRELYVQSVLSYGTSIVIGLFILYANDFKLEEISKENRKLF
jgi:hypothetical protein